MNITDVGHLTSDSDSGDDKMLLASKRENKSAYEIARYYTECFKSDCEKLNIKWPDIVSNATDNIDEYIKIITKLLKDGYAYQAGGNVYFDTSKLKDYYVLTNHKEDEMVVGVRAGVDEDSNKKHQADFVLWFTNSKFVNHEMQWDSPWGRGYPGWHIECTGISMKYLGEHLDIHCGGIDNIFPHHTNEIAQSESYLGHKWCNYWVHGEYLIEKDGKMSKSKGEFLTVSLLESKGYNPLCYRYLVLKSHYRNPLVFSYNILDGAVQEYQKLKNKITSLKKEGKVDNSKVEFYDKNFKDAISDDLNTSMALTILYDVLKDSEITSATKIELIKKFDTVLSLDLFKNEKVEISDDMKKMIEEKINERNIAKKNRDFSLADKIRDELKEKGIIIKDTREGTVYEVVE